MQILGVLILTLASVSANAEMKCPSNSYQRVACSLKPPPAATAASIIIKEVVVCQLDAEEGIIVYPTSLSSTDIAAADYFPLNNGYDLVKGNGTIFGGPIEIRTPRIPDATRRGPAPSTVVVGRQNFEANCTVDRTVQSFRQTKSAFLPVHR